MRVILVTFGGRERSIKTLFQYIVKYKQYFDEYHIYIATTNVNDTAYMEQFASQHSFVKIIYTMKDGSKVLDDKNYIWDNAYNNCMEEDTLYLKLDDDIVYIDETLFTTFLDFCKANPDIPLIYPTIINNIFTSWRFEKDNIFSSDAKSIIGDTWKDTYARIKDKILENVGKQIKIGQLVPSQNEILCPAAWGNLQYCIDLHIQFLQDLANNNIQKYTSSNNWILENCEPASIGCVCWNGGTFKKIVTQYGKVKDDEPWWTIYIPTWTGKKNVIFRGAVVSHYSYYKQRDLGLDRTDILEKYYDYSNK